MATQKRMATSFISVIVALGVFILLLHTFGLQGYTSQDLQYHRTPRGRLARHFASQRIKPQTLPKTKVFHPQTFGGPNLQNIRMQLETHRLQVSTPMTETSPPKTDENVDALSTLSTEGQPVAGTDQVEQAVGSDAPASDGMPLGGDAAVNTEGSNDVVTAP